MSTQNADFKNSAGHNLSARLEMPEGIPRAFALFLHCFTCGKDSAAAVRLTRALAAHGIAVLRYDFIGIGRSGGAFEDSTFSTNVDDAVAAAAYLRTNHQAPALVIGHSLGGATALTAATKIPEARAVVTIGAPSETHHVVHNFERHLEEIEKRGQAEVSLGGRTYTIVQALLDNLRSHKLDATISKLRRALLVMHAPLDKIVGVEHAARIFDAAKHPKSFVSLDGADHFLSNAADAEFAASVISVWAERYLPKAAEQAQRDMVSVA
jgi:fermentation-respiration switch protein FrsA (DUF1100 family)